MYTQSHIYETITATKLHARYQGGYLLYTMRILVIFYYRYITQEGHKLEVAPRPPPAVTNAVHWRADNIRYKRNEVFLDVVESVNLLVRIKDII